MMSVTGWRLKTDFNRTSGALYPLFEPGSVSVSSWPFRSDAFWSGLSAGTIISVRVKALPSEVGTAHGNKTAKVHSFWNRAGVETRDIELAIMHG